MLSNRLQIDGDDAYTEYGVYVEENGLNELIAFSPLKPFPFTDWHEYDGIEVDLTVPVLNTKEVQLKLVCVGGYNRIAALLKVLSYGTYHFFSFNTLGRVYKLRLASLPNLTGVETLHKITLKLADDFPLYNINQNATPLNVIPTKEDYKLDSRWFSDYGVNILQGALAEIVKAPNVKQNLTRNISIRHGVWYAATPTITYKTKDVKLHCLMRANTLKELWNNYDALLMALIKPNERTLYVGALGQAFKCCYKSCQVNTFYPTGKIWLDFTLTVTFTNSARLTF